MDPCGVKTTVICALFAAVCTNSATVHAGSGSASFNIGATVVRPGTGQTASRVESKPARTSLAPTRLRYTCGAAKISLRRQGFRSIHPVNCSGTRYRFLAIKSARSWDVTVNAHGGQIVRVLPKR